MVCKWILYSVNLACTEMAKKHNLLCQKCQKSRTFCFAKMSKITLFLWKDFGQNLCLREFYEVFHVCSWVPNTSGHYQKGQHDLQCLIFKQFPIEISETKSMKVILQNNVSCTNCVEHSFVFTYSIHHFI